MQTTQLTLFPEENPRFLTEQIITYIGNKRSLLGFIATAVNRVKKSLNKEKLDVVDLFSGSGVVARFLKQHARTLHVNDLEDYCETINRCYLTNAEEIDFDRLDYYYKSLLEQLDNNLHRGFIAEMYSPKDDNNIQKGERVFYTTRNAMYIDTARETIEELPEPYRTFLLAPLIYEASVHTNTSGVFKGFYKNSQTGVGQFGGNGKHALQRIMADIELKLPVFSNFSCDVKIYKKDANKLARELPPVDLIYMDPPYNQHPYGSNYFMLNLVNNYDRPTKVSKVSGIPEGWNKSQYNSRQTAFESMKDLCLSLNAKYLLISFSNDGFMSRDDMLSILTSIGEVEVYDKEYNTFRGSRNLNCRDIHVKEYLYLVRRKEKQDG